MVNKKQNLLSREEKEIEKVRSIYAKKFPWLFAIAGAFGIVSIFYSLEKIIDRIDLFTDNPWILLGTGITVLAVTGSFYNKLR